jgi:hypothetical protein
MEMRNTKIYNLKHTYQPFVLSAFLLVVSVISASAQEFTAPQYSPQDAAAIVKEIYKRVLERTPDDGGLVLFSGKISGGKWNILQIVQAIGTSPEYANRFIKDQTPRQAIILMYRHFLLREPENEQVINSHVGDLNGKGWHAKVLDFANSPEAQKLWPYPERYLGRAAPQKASGNPALLGQGCKFFLGRNNDYLCTQQSGFDICEKLKKDGKNNIVGCHLAGVDAEVDKALVSQGCRRTAVGHYTCVSPKGFDACEAFRKARKTTACARQSIIKTKN